MALTGFKCAECGYGFKIKVTHKDIWTAFCCPVHSAKWSSERTEEQIIKHQFGDNKPWGPWDRCQWCHCTLKSGYHEESCPVRAEIEKIQDGKS